MKPRRQLVFPSSDWAASSLPEMLWSLCSAGATAVQVGTASYADPRATERLAKGAWSRGAAAITWNALPASSARSKCPQNNLLSIACFVSGMG